jgi:coenzyme PQQ precursor peptide PqqA
MQPRLQAHPALQPKGDPMTWTTPQACDFRFGFEITMYVAAR